MGFARLGVASALVSFVVAGCSSNASPTREGAPSSTAQAIQGGTTDTSDTFAVGVCLGLAGSAGQCEGYCSGALITPNLVVLARHCVSDSPEQIDCAQNPTFGSKRVPDTSIYVTTNSSMFSSSGYHQVKQVVVPTTDALCGNDIALLILKDTVASSEAKPIVPGVQYPMNDARYSESFTAIGYGATSPTQQGQQQVGTRRILQNIKVLCIPGDPLIDCQGAVADNEFVGGSGTCQGDSGSSAYESSSFAKGTPLSFGVLSRGGVSTDGQTCQDSVYTRLDKWRDLVVNTATQASNNWTLYPKPVPDWTVYVPPADADGGTSTSTPQGSAGLGDTCKTNHDCAGNLCVDEGDGTLVCSATCTTDASCGSDTLACASGYCVPKNSPSAKANAAPATTTTTTSGCSVSGAAGDPQPTPWRWAAGLGLVGLAFARRRRSTAS